MAGPDSAQDIAAQDDAHYVIAQRGHEDRVEADAATGEVVIG